MSARYPLQSVKALDLNRMHSVADPSPSYPKNPVEASPALASLRQLQPLTERNHLRNAYNDNNPVKQQQLPPSPSKDIQMYDAEHDNANVAKPQEQAPAPEPRPVQDNATPKPRKEKKKDKEKLSSLCKTPPSTIKNSRKNKSFKRGLCLGAGGFARCFQVKDQSGQIYAAKTVAKASLTSEKSRSKIVAEIKIHQQLRHPNIVQYIDGFEDDQNVYILLEMCPNNSLMDLIRKRKSLTEPECRFYVTQIVGAVKYMHDMGVIHRDLKLGNIFLDGDMNVKIGDFGLAALLVSKNDRKKTICGTPNYIAPEVLFGKEKGHSYEVDIWSIGIILYVMLYGKPPFQSKNVEAIYDRIKRIDYEFPENNTVSEEAKDLIMSLLTFDPERRPTLERIMEHPFFLGEFPEGLDPSIITTVPSQFIPMDSRVAEHNFIECKIKTRLMERTMHMRSKKGRTVLDVLSDETRNGLIQMPDKGVLPSSISPASTKDKYKMVMVHTNNYGRVDRGGEELGKSVPITNTNSIHDGKHRQQVQEQHQQQELHKQQKHIATDQYGISTSPGKSQRANFDQGVQEINFDFADVPHPYDVFGIGLNNLNNLITNPGREFVVASGSGIAPPLVTYITKWVDYSNKYGIGYELANGMAGVLKPDQSTIQLNTFNGTFDMIHYNRSLQQMIMQRIHNVPGQQLRSSDAKQLTLATSMHSYMDKNLRECGNSSSCCVDSGRQALQAGEPQMEGSGEENALGSPVDSTIYLYDFLRLGNNSFMFQLSNGDCQVNFSDHTKFVFLAHGEGVAIIDSAQIHYLGFQDLQYMNGGDDNNSINSLGSPQYHVCCEEFYDRLMQDDMILNFVRNKMALCKRELKESLME